MQDAVFIAQLKGHHAMTDLIARISDELRLGKSQVEAAVALLKEDAPALFIARYRKDKTGGLDETKVRAIQERLAQMSEMEQRRATAIKTISEGSKMTPELQAKLESTTSRVELEDLYMAFRSRRRVRSSAAKAKGLDPLADLIMKQHQPAGGTPAAAATPAAASATPDVPPATPDVVKESVTEEAQPPVDPTQPAPTAAAPAPSGSAEEIVKPYLNADKGVKDMAEALAGARDIVAEHIAEDAPSRKIARELLLAEGKVVTKARDGIDLSKGKYAAFAQFSEPVAKIALHKLLNAMRGASEKQLALVIEAPREKIIQQLKDKWMTNPEALLKPELALAIEECFDRLLGPALDNELRQDLKRRVDLETSAVCTRNLRALLMQAPFGAKPVLALEPGQNVGTKAAVLDGAGKLIANAVLTLEKGDDERKAATETLVKLVKEHGVKAVAIGSGAGSKEADLFVRDTLKTAELGDVFSIIVHLHGAAQTAREDLADIDAALRGAVLIGRRLQDPLSELARIDPTTLNLSQYQHEADTAMLKQKLDEVLESCVSTVGADVNTAPASLLRYVAGIGAAQAGLVAEARKTKSGFKAREDLKDMAGCGPRTFEFAAGFTRIKDSANPLDNTAIHPEHYAVVEAMATAQNTTVKDLLGNAELIGKIDLAALKSDAVGELALKDIVEDLKNPGRDPRGEFSKPDFSPELRELKDLKEGSIVTGVVTNLTAFGAFVDVGVHQDGLVHISALTHKFIRDASEAVTLGQRVKVKVLSVDADKKRISLSMKELETPPQRRPSTSSAQRPARPPRGPRPAGQGAPASGAPGGQNAGAQGSRPPRRDSRPPRGPRPASAPQGAATPGAPAAAGAPGSAPAAGGAPSRFSGKRPSGGGRDSGPRRGDSREGPPRAKPVEPGKPDYSKFFVKGKRKEREKDKRGPRTPDGASRDEVREVMRKQEGGGNTLADLLRKAGVATDDAK